MKHGVQVRLAEQSGLSEGFISLMLKGERRPRWVNAKILGQITNSDPSVWMDGDLEKIEEILELWPG